MATKRKLWKVSALGRWQDGVLRSPLLTIYVDNRDGRGWTTHERIDLRDIVALWEVK